MVVLKDQSDAIRKRFGDESINRWRDFSLVIGYSISIDQELKIELNPDRPDLFSFATLDMASKVYYGSRAGRKIRFTRSKRSIYFKSSAKRLRPFFTVFEATGPTIGDNMTDLIDYQEKLHESIGKERKKVSIGIHDQSSLTFPITYEGRESKDISFTTYDGFHGTAAQILESHPRGLEYRHLISPGTLVPIISDARGNVLSMPPIVNGSITKVESDSSRFLIDITGTEMRPVRAAAWMLANYFSSLGYKISLPEIIHESKEKRLDMWKESSVMLTSGTISAVLGVSVQAETAIRNLRKMDLMTSQGEYPLEVSIPGYRDDIMGEVDVIEDLAKSMRYSNIPEKPLSLPLSGKASDVNDFSYMLRNIFIGSGFQEVMTYVVAAAGIYGEFGLHSNYEIMNPKSTDFSFIRSALYPGMLDFLKHNKNRSIPQRIFEIGHVVEEDKERVKACLMVIGPKANYASLKSMADAVMQRISGTRVEVESASIPAIIDGRGGNILVNGEVVGIIGEVHPKHLDSFELSFPVCFMELNLEILRMISGH
ncbi:MAG: phenylalanine--tRNA ligase subunit beta [Candidatus Thermoplasmatota archaeon]|nr:phenylalanine--tRNA ligase subunit beta [Candidatus Thermoplasmatota archaeon]